MSKLKEKANPVTEFQNDPMMKELHENRIKSFMESKNKKTKEKILLIREKAEKFRNQGNK